MLRWLSMRVEIEKRMMVAMLVGTGCRKSLLSTVVVYLLTPPPGRHALAVVPSLTTDGGVIRDAVISTIWLMYTAAEMVSRGQSYFDILWYGPNSHSGHDRIFFAFLLDFLSAACPVAARSGNYILFIIQRARTVGEMGLPRYWFRRTWRRDLAAYDGRSHPLRVFRFERKDSLQARARL